MAPCSSARDKFASGISLNAVCFSPLRRLLRCVYENGPLYCFDTHPDIVFISRDSLMPLYKMLRIDCAFGVSFQDWFDLVQHAAEESVCRGGGTRLFVDVALTSVFVAN
jgi:hypothetical protein